jgi:hypothetical protein
MAYPLSLVSVFHTLTGGKKKEGSSVLLGIFTTKAQSHKDFKVFDKKTSCLRVFVVNDFGFPVIYGSAKRVNPAWQFPFS